MWRVRSVLTGVAGSPYISTFHFNDNQVSAQGAATAIQDFWDELASLINGEAEVNVDGEVYQVDASSGQTVGVEATTTGSVFGTNASEPLPPANQALIRWSTGQWMQGREIRGKTFIGALTDTVNGDGGLTTAAQTQIQSAATNLLAVGAGALQIYSRMYGAAAFVTGASVWNEFAVLRSRRD